MLVVSYGGGTNSTAMLVGFVERGIVPDVITFADTGGEKPPTYQYVDFFSRWLIEHGMPEITVVRYDGKYDTLENECLGSGTLPSLAYGYKKCSQKWKLYPQDKFLKQHPMAISTWESGGKVKKAIGYDAGEAHRSIHIKEDDKYSYWYPLIDWVWNRDRCVAEIEKVGIPSPPKSACFFCPATRKGEILQMRNCYPDLVDRAINIERTAMSNEDNPIRSIVGLGRNWSWEQFLRSNDEQRELFDDQGSIPCMCFDGDYGDER
jgi:hypothetical protein